MIERLPTLIKSHRHHLTNGGFLAYSNLITSITSFGIVYIFANFIPQETFGTYKYVLSIASILSIFTLQGMNTAVAQSVSRGYENALKEGIRTKILFGSIGTAIGLTISAYYFLQENTILGSSFLVTALAIPFFGTFNLYRSYLNGKKEYKAIARETTLYNIAFFLLFSAVLLLTNNIVVILLGYFLFSVLLQLYIYLKISQTLRNTQQTTDPEIVGYAKHLSLLKGLTVASGSIGTIALWQILGPLALPVYTLALAPIEQVRPMLQLTENLLMPSMAQKTWKAHSIGWFFKKSATFLLIILLLVAIYIGLAPLIYELFFPNYAESVFLSQVFSVSLLFTGINIILMTIMKSKKQIRNLYLSNGILIFFDLLTIPAIYFFGILGLVVNVLLGKAFLTLVSLFLIFKRTR